MSQDGVVSIRLRRNTTSTPWGFRMQGGNEYGTVLFVQKVNPKSLSYRQGLRLNDRLVAIGNLQTHGMSHEYAKMEIIRAGNELDLLVQRSPGQDQTDHHPVRKVPEQSQMSEEPTEYRGYTNPNVQSRSFKILQESLSYSESNEAGTGAPTGHTPGEGVVQRAYSEGRRRLEELYEINPRNFTTEGESPYKYNSPHIEDDDRTALNGVQPVAAKQYEGVHSAPREIPPPAPEPQMKVHHPQTKTTVNIGASSVLSPAGTQQEYLAQAHQYYQGEQPNRNLKLVNYQFDQQFGNVQQTPGQAQVRQQVQVQQQASDFIPATKTVSSVAEDLDLKLVKSESGTAHTQVLPVATVAVAQTPAAPQPQQAVTTQEQPRRRRQRVRPTRDDGQQPATQTGQATVVVTASTDATDGISASKPAEVNVSHPPQAQTVVVQQAQTAQVQVNTVSKPEPPAHSVTVPAADPPKSEPKPTVQVEPKPVEPEKPKSEAPPAEPEKPKAEAPPAEPEKPKAEAPPAEPEKPKAEAPPAEPEKPKAEAPPAEPEKPKAEAPPAEPEKPKAEAPPAEPEKPKAEAPPAEPEKPKQEAPPAEPEKPKVEEQPKTETAQKQETQEVVLEEKEIEQTKSDEAVTSESSVDTVVEVGKADTESTETIEIQHEQTESVVVAHIDEPSVEVSASHEESEVTISVGNDADLSTTISVNEEAVINVGTSNETETATVLEISSEHADTQSHSEVDESVTFSVSEEISIDADHEVVIENVDISGESQTGEHDESATEVTFSMDVGEPESTTSTETKTETKTDEKKHETNKDEKKPEGKKDESVSKPGKRVGKLNLEDRMPHSRSAQPKRFVDSRGGVSERLARLQKK